MILSAALSLFGLGLLCGSPRVTMRRAVGSQSAACIERNFQTSTGRWL